MANPLWQVPGLAAASLRHERILTLCVILALAAVIAPLLTLLGLRHGTIETLRQGLVEDPVYREIRPAQTREYPPEWFTQWQTQPGIGFLQPTILPASSIITAVVPNANGKTELLDLVPTGAGDPLLLENHAAIPNAEQCVLTSDAARRLGVKVGDWLELRATRSRGGRSEIGPARLQVLAILSPRAGNVARIYTELAFVLDVEAYKEGQAVATRQWAGESQAVYPSFDGVVVLLKEPLNAIDLSGLVINTGLAKAEPLPEVGFQQRIGRPLPADSYAYDLSIPQGSIGNANLDAVIRKLRGREALLLPYTQPLQLQFKQQSYSVRGLSVNQEHAQRLGLPTLPWGEYDGQTRDITRLKQALLPDGVEPNAEWLFQGLNPLRFTLQTAGTSPDQQLWVAAELMGLLRTAQQRAVMLNSDGGFNLARSGFRGFRLYARSIDDVPELVQQFQAQGIEVIAQVDAIERIRTLDRGLGQLFWLIAALSISGAVAVLVASLYAAVQRRRRDLGVLRLLGLTRRQVFFFPICQGLLLALFGLLAGAAGYAVLAFAINQVFAAELAAGQALCRLPSEYLGIAVGLTLVLSVLSALVAAGKTTGIEPAEAIREE